MNFLRQEIIPSRESNANPTQMACFVVKLLEMAQQLLPSTNCQKGRALGFLRIQHETIPECQKNEPFFINFLTIFFSTIAGMDTFHHSLRILIAFKNQNIHRLLFGIVSFAHFLSFFPYFSFLFCRCLFFLFRLSLVSSTLIIHRFLISHEISLFLGDMGCYISLQYPTNITAYQTPNTTTKFTSDTIAFFATFKATDTNANITTITSTNSTTI